MEPFIKNHQYNIIRREMTQITKLLKYNSDAMIIDAVKESAQEKIEAIFSDLSGEARDALQMRHLMDEAQVNGFLADLNDLTYGMVSVTDGQISRFFRKEKKLKLPEAGLGEQCHTYLGWRDEGRKRLYILYRTEEGLKGMACQINPSRAKNTTMCALCGHMSDRGEVVSATVRCKTNTPDGYHAIGFNICSDSRACNSRITEPDRLDRLLAKVTGVKAN